MLSYNIRQTGDVTILDLTGRLSLGEAVAFGPGSGAMLGETVREWARKGRKKIVLNLAEVTYVDSSGIGQLVGELHRMWKNFGIAMEKEYRASKGRRRKR